MQQRLTEQDADIMKLVYVTVGTEKTEYLNMLRISAASARKHMPDIEIEVVTDAVTGEYLNASDIPQKYRVRINAVAVDDSLNTVEKSRELKTTLRTLVKGTFLYLDNDTIICRDFSDFEPEASVNLVADAHTRLDQQENGERIRKNARKRGLDLDRCERYFNGGVIIAKDDDTAHRFFEKWHDTWLRTKRPGMHHDQYSLNAVEQEMHVIHELGGTWNCQLTANDKAFSYLKDVRILHYLSLQREGIYCLNRAQLMKETLSNEQIREIIDRPELQFMPFHFYADDSIDYQIMQGSHYHLVHRIYTRHPKLYRFGEKLFSKLRK